MGEIGQHPGQFDTRQARHVDVEEDRIDGVGVEFAQRGGGIGRGVDGGDIGVFAQQVGQFVQGGSLVVDGEYRQLGAHPKPPPSARTPDRNFGTRMMTFVPAPIAVSTTRP